MRKINNPYTRMEEHYCFACSSRNIHGLQMEFLEDGDEVVCEWDPRDYFQGYVNVLHGGIQATLMDEIASWIVQIKLKTAGLTASLNVRYKKPVPMNEGNITIRAKIVKMRRNLADIQAKLYNSKGEVCSESDVTFFTFPKEVAVRKFDYPDYDSFFVE